MAHNPFLVENINLKLIVFILCPFNFLFKTEQFVADMDLQTVSTCLFTRLLRTSSSTVQPVSDKIYWKNFAQGFKSMFHNSFVVKNANDKLIMFILSVFYFQICFQFSLVLFSSVV